MTQLELEQALTDLRQGLTRLSDANKVMVGAVNELTRRNATFYALELAVFVVVQSEDLDSLSTLLSRIEAAIQGDTP